MRYASTARRASFALIAAALLLPAARAAAQPCAQVFERLYPDGATAKVRNVLNEAGNDITYGFEGEVSPQKAPKLLEWYRPSNKTDAEWFAMSLEERKTHLGGDRAYGYVKTSRAPEWMHEKLSTDPGGSEFMTRPTNKLEEALGWINAIEAHLGQDQHGRSHVYWQSNVAYKRAGNFSRENRDGLTGYVKATGDYAQLGKLYKGWEIHQRNSSYIPGKNLGHGVLGPLNTTVMQQMEAELVAASEQRTTNAHSHYFQGSFFRTWPYPDRNGFEVRDAHKDVGVLKRETRRLTQGLEKGFSKYASFKDLTVLDETAHYNQMSETVKNLLRTVANSYKGRYALPMRPFENEYPRALGLGGQAAQQLSSKITSARAAYLQSLESIAGAEGDNKAKLNKVRVALSKFAHDSGIYTALDNHFANIGRN